MFARKPANRIQPANRKRFSRTVQVISRTSPFGRNIYVHQGLETQKNPGFLTCRPLIALFLHRNHCVITMSFARAPSNRLVTNSYCTLNCHRHATMGLIHLRMLFIPSFLSIIPTIANSGICYFQYSYLSTANRSE